MMARKLALEWHGSNRSGFVADTAIGEVLITRDVYIDPSNLKEVGVYRISVQMDSIIARVGTALKARQEAESILREVAHELIAQLTPKEDDHA